MTNKYGKDPSEPFHYQTYCNMDWANIDPEYWGRIHEIINIDDEIADLIQQTVDEDQNAVDGEISLKVRQATLTIDLRGQNYAHFYIFAIVCCDTGMPGYHYNWDFGTTLLSKVVGAYVVNGNKFEAELLADFHSEFIQEMDMRYVTEVLGVIDAVQSDNHCWYHAHRNVDLTPTIQQYLNKVENSPLEDYGVNLYIVGFSEACNDAGYEFEGATEFSMDFDIAANDSNTYLFTPQRK